MHILYIYIYVYYIYIVYYIICIFCWAWCSISITISLYTKMLGMEMKTKLQIKIQFYKCKPSKSTSPTTSRFPVSQSWTSLMPTSMTTASSFTMSAEIRPGIPVATTRISAFCVNNRSWSFGVYR